MPVRAHAGARPRRCGGMAARRVASRGFTFLGLLFLIIVMALMATAAATTWTFMGQRDKEEQLIFVGREYRSALSRYALAHARQPQPYPTSLRRMRRSSPDRTSPCRTQCPCPSARACGSVAGQTG